MIKLFQMIRQEDLENAVNRWISSNDVVVVSVAYQVARNEGENWHYACVHYQPQK